MPRRIHRISATCEPFNYRSTFTSRWINIVDCLQFYLDRELVTDTNISVKFSRRATRVSRRSGNRRLCIGRRFCSATVILTTAASLSEIASANEEMGRSKPNVLFIAIDDLSSHLGAMGQEAVVSPHIDRLADEGVLFRNHYVSMTVFIPSRVAMLTGVRPDTTRQLFSEHHFRKTVPGISSIPEYFHETGSKSFSPVANRPKRINA